MAQTKKGRIKIIYKLKFNSIIMKKILMLVLITIVSFSYGQSSEFFLRRGLKNYNLEKYKEAILDCTKAIKLDPKNIDAYVIRGESKGQLQNFKSAIDDFTKAITLSPNNKIAYYNRGYCRLFLNQKESACLDWSKASKLGLTLANDLIKKNCN